MLPPLPRFIIIGAQKSATRWLRRNLGLHPDVHAAPTEIKYFNHPKRYQALDARWYQAQFKGWAGEPITGESTPGYMMLRHRPDDVAARIDETVPAVRLIVLLRNPVDRANSALVHHIREERVHPRTRLLDHIRMAPPEQDWLGLVDGGRYAASLEPFLSRFGDRLLILLHDDIRDGPRSGYEQALDHIGATGGYLPPGLADVVSSNLQGGEAGPAISAEDRAQLFELFSEDVARLETMIGRDLSMWRLT